MMHGLYTAAVALVVVGNVVFVVIAGTEKIAHDKILASNQAKHPCSQCIPYQYVKDTSNDS